MAENSEEISAEEFNKAANTYNHYVDLLNVLNLNVVTSLSSAITNLNTAYEVLDRSIDSSEKKSILSSLTDNISYLTGKKNTLQNTVIPAIEQKMQSLDSEYKLTT